MLDKIKQRIELFREGVTDEYCFSVLGKSVHIRNGKSHFMGGDDEYLLENEYIQIGFGRVESGYGDWGGGATHATTSPLKITVDKSLVIRKIETDSFYNSRESKRMEKKAQKIADRLQVGKKLKIKNIKLKHHVTEILKAIPTDTPIGHDVFKTPHMLNYYTR